MGNNIKFCSDVFKSFLLIYFLLANWNCSVNKFTNNSLTPQINGLKKGDPIKIQFVDRTWEDYVFLGQDSSNVFVSILENNTLSEKSINIKNIQKIKKLEKHPNKIITGYMVLAFLSVLIYASYLGNIGKLVA